MSIFLSGEETIFPGRLSIFLKGGKITELQSKKVKRREIGGWKKEECVISNVFSENFEVSLTNERILKD